MLNKEEFSDVTFVVDNKKFFAHKIITSQLSEKFKAMFSGASTGGFIEAQKNVIKIENISYNVFAQIMKYLYSGEFDLGPQISKYLELHAQELEKQNERSASDSQASGRR